MKEIKSFEMELCHTRELGHEVVANDNNLAEVIGSQLGALDDSYQTLQAGAQSTYVCITVIIPELTACFVAFFVVLLFLLVHCKDPSSIEHSCACHNKSFQF